MNRNEVIARLRTVEPVLRARGVRSLYLFGSYGRNDAKPGSDIDVFVEAERDDLYELSNYMGAYRALSDVFPGLQVGYTTRDGLSKYVRADIEREAVQIF